MKDVIEYLEIKVESLRDNERWCYLKGETKESKRYKLKASKFAAAISILKDGNKQ